MTSGEIIGIIQAIGGVALSGLAAYYAYKSQIISLENKQHILEVKKDITTVEKATNSMKDALVAATRGEALLEGHKAGVEEQKQQQQQQNEKDTTV